MPRTVVGGDGTMRRRDGGFFAMGACYRALATMLENAKRELPSCLGSCKTRASSHHGDADGAAFVCALSSSKAR